MIKIYGSKNCVWCTKAKDLCENYSIIYEYSDAEDLDIYEEMKNKIPHKNPITLPQIFWNNRYIGGFRNLEQEIENTNIGNYGQGTI